MDRKEQSLKYLPISLFSIVMGLTGYALASQKMIPAAGLPQIVPAVILAAAAGVFALLLVLYLLKMIFHFESFKQEWNHPVLSVFFPAVSISLLLIGTGLTAYDPNTARILWYTGAAAQLLLSVRTLAFWIVKEIEFKAFSPAWFIPVVGNLLVPVSGADFAPKEVSWFFFAVGFLFWIILFTILIYRLIFHHPLPDKLVPTFFILIAPPSVAFVSLSRLSETPSQFANGLFYIAVFILLLLIGMIKLFSSIRFHTGWWAYSFPLASLSIASFVYWKQNSIAAAKILSIVLWGLLSALVLFLTVKTVMLAVKKKLFVQEE